jgi:malate synthase
MPPLHTTTRLPHGVDLLVPTQAAWSSVLSPKALAFVAGLERHFGPLRARLLKLRRERHARFDQGERPRFLEATAAIRGASWKIAPVPHDLRDRRVEITGPAERKMIINALNSGANVFMADFEDSISPTWANLVEGQASLREAVRRTLAFESAEGKRYRLNERTAVLMARPRGWHLEEHHLTVDGKPVSASLFDFGLYFFHNVRELLARGTGPYFYLPKLESHLEARLWNDVFLYAQAELGLPRGTIKATVLIETLPAAFEMDEILHELREHSAGLNCGRWDYIFSFIKKLQADPSAVLPDRARLAMTEHFLRSYSLLLIQTCHRRGAHAIGGMAAQIPIKHDPARHAAAMEKVRADKLREASDGHDGTWVAHPGLVELAREVFDAQLVGENQIHTRPRQDVTVTAEDLLQVPEGPITEAGVRLNLAVGVQYLAAWLCGSGCVPLRDLMEDAATAEISRAQLWQWLRHRARLEDGRVVDAQLVASLLQRELAQLRERLGPEGWVRGRFELAQSLFHELVSAPQLADFLTLPAYEHLIATREIPCAK